VQALADMGIVGFAVFVAVFAAGIVVALRAVGAGAPDAALVGLAWLLVAAGVWNGFGLVAGISLDALTWLGLGLAATRVESRA
jgi:O-antigen ligase